MTIDDITKEWWLMLIFSILVNIIFISVFYFVKWLRGDFAGDCKSVKDAADYSASLISYSPSIEYQTLREEILGRIKLRKFEIFLYNHEYILMQSLFANRSAPNLNMQTSPLADTIGR